MMEGKRDWILEGVEESIIETLLVVKELTMKWLQRRERMVRKTTSFPEYYSDDLTKKTDRNFFQRSLKLIIETVIKVRMQLNLYILVYSIHTQI